MREINLGPVANADGSPTDLTREMLAGTGRDAAAFALDALWAQYGAATHPLGDKALATALGFASYKPTDRDWGVGLNMRQINMLDLNAFKTGWENARIAAESAADFTAWRNAWIPGGE